jgi:hypothetical protein
MTDINTDMDHALVIECCRILAEKAVMCDWLNEKITQRVSGLSYEYELEFRAVRKANKTETLGPMEAFMVEVAPK